MDNSSINKDYIKLKAQRAVAGISLSRLELLWDSYVSVIGNTQAISYCNLNH